MNSKKRFGNIPIQFHLPLHCNCKQWWLLTSPYAEQHLIHIWVLPMPLASQSWCDVTKRLVTSVYKTCEPPSLTIDATFNDDLLKWLSNPINCPSTVWQTSISCYHMSKLKMQLTFDLICQRWISAAIICSKWCKVMLWLFSTCICKLDIHCLDIWMAGIQVVFVENISKTSIPYPK